MKYGFLFCILLYTLPAAAQSSGSSTYCNPIDVGYRYNFEQQNEKISYRSGADPVIVMHQNEYYLFSTIAEGWWHSADLIRWNHISPDKWTPRGVVAPAAYASGDTIYLLPSTFDRLPIYAITEPKTGHLEYFNRLMPFLPGAAGPWDPAFYHDPETDRWYLYWGSSNVYPIYGIQLSYENHLSYQGKPKEFIYLQPEEHGWERFGQDHRDTIKPFIEGAWMTKHNDKYYLQYGAPGTEYNVYANGTYVGDDPMGPFTYAPYNPVSYKPGGFATGAGHGNTFQDKHGNYWNTGTAWVAVNWNFERRIVMFPTGFDEDGQMYADTRFGDFPHKVPTSKWDKSSDLFTGWMLLSYKKPVEASSVRDTFPATNVTDENTRTFWVAENNRAGETLTLDLQKTYDIKAVQVNFTDYQSDIYESDTSVYTQFRLYSSADRKNWQKIADLTQEKRDRPNAYIELPNSVKGRYIRYEHVHVASPNLAINDIRVFGNGNGKMPKTPTKFTARRDTTDTRNAFVSWQRVPDAVGYNVRWGIAPDKLYLTYQVFADANNELEVRALNKGQDYYFAIEAFDDNGVSKLSEVLFCPNDPENR